MRFALLLLLALSACGKSGLPAGDDLGGVAGSGGGGGGGTGGVGGGTGGSGGGGSAPDCSAACNRCPSGPCCGSACCGAGEWCDAATLTCKCGSGPACTNGDVCAHGGPIGPNQNPCGILCCGGKSGNPCPL